MNLTQTYTSEFDVYRRQILTYKNGPRAEMVKIKILSEISTIIM